jgi:CheY-like chemotaxis protein
MRSKILIVDDEAPIARALGRALRTHDVVVLDRAADALDAIRTGARFDAILCDLMMPEMTGEALHAALLDLAPDQAAAMIFLTGGATTSLALEFLARVPNARLEKPFELSTLGALIDKHLGS